MKLFSQVIIFYCYFIVNPQNHKLEKNRESARNSRKRKKLYIELLEQKVADLSERLVKS